MVRRNQQIVGLLYTLPALSLILLLLYSPSIYAFIYSLYETSFLQLKAFTFPKNYLSLFVEKDIQNGLVRSLLFTFAALAITIPVGFSLSLWINKFRNWVGVFIQIIALIPWVISMVVASLLWRWIFVGEYGVASYVLTSLGVKTTNVFENPSLSMGILIGVGSWRTLGYAMVLIIAALKGIPSELYEAAQVDGAGRIRQFVSITLPLVRTALTILFVILTLSYFNVVTVPLVLTGGGPGTATNVLSLELYRQAFVYYNYGLANALAASMFIVNMTFVMVYSQILRRRSDAR
jgi:ABC-type sugar transport system permease subunit